jgi:hypothetical protein
MLARSKDLLGRSAANSYNLGLCSQRLGRPEDALVFMTEACLLDSTFEQAWLARGRLSADFSPVVN